MKIQYTKRLNKNVQNAISMKGKYHDPNTVFTYSFIGGNLAQHNHVNNGLRKMKALIPEFKFKQVASGGDVRISFDARIGSWSYLGTDIFQIPQNQATMNLGWQESSHRVVIHEWCHTLNMSHEHTRGINWDKPKVYSYFAKIGWSKSDVDRNLFSFNEDTHDFDEDIDTESIMLYYFPCELTLDNKNCNKVNHTLSKRDLEKLRQMFGKETPEFGVKRYLKTIFTKKEHLGRLLEPQVVKVANSLGLVADVLDLKADTISRIWAKLEE